MTHAFLRCGLMLPALAFCGASAAAAPIFTLAGQTPMTLTQAALSAAEKSETAGRSSPDGKTLTFTRKAVRLVVVTGPEDDMLSYRIAGQRNPVLSVPKGAILTVLFVNTDDDMRHDLRFGPALVSFPNTPTETGSIGTLALLPRSGAVLHGETLTVRLPETPGTYAYFCTVRGHAEGGMAGKVVVR